MLGIKLPVLLILRRLVLLLEDDDDDEEEEEEEEEEGDDGIVRGLLSSRLVAALGVCDPAEGRLVILGGL